MTDVVSSDVSALILSKKERLTSIRESRKRKLATFWEVASCARAPFAQAADDSPATQPEKVKFFNDNEVLQGPFLNERFLPARRIPPVDGSTPHDAGAISPIDAVSAHSGKSEPQAIKPTPTPIPISSGPSLPRPAQPDATRAPPKTLSASPLPQSGVAPLQPDHNPPSSSSGVAPNPYRPHDPSEVGSISTDNASQSDMPQGRREGAGGQVTFAEPEKQTEVPTRTNGIKQPSTIEKIHAGNENREAVADAMDIDEATEEPSRFTSLRPTPVDAPRPTDILSSPGSTAQTATTPAVHDASPDTSPENGGPQYPVDDDDLAPEVVDQGFREGAESSFDTKGDPGGLRDPAALKSASQSFAESAGASSSSSHENGAQSHAEGSQMRPLDQNVETQNTNQAAPQIVESCESRSTRDDTLASQPATGSSAGLTEPPPADHHESEPTGFVSGAHENTSQAPEAQDPLPPHTNHSTPTESADLSQNSPDSQQRTQISSSSLARKRILAERQGRNWSKARTILFEKPPKEPAETTLTSQNRGTRIPTNDYFVPLFLEGFARASDWMKGPDYLLQNTHKTISSSDYNIVLQENQACKVLRRIYHLQQHDKWSLRQLKRCPEPPRLPSHWDTLLGEMRWMRTDFREERKWKRMIARNLAEACAEWMASSDEERKELQVNARIPEPVSNLSSNDSALPPDAESLPTSMPDLVPSNDADSPMDIDDEPHEWDRGTIAPSAVFTLQNDEVVFSLQESAASDQLFSELPLYQAPLKVPENGPTPDYYPDARWRRDALPLVKYVEGELALKPAGPPLERSRFKYIAEDDESDSEFVDSQSSVEHAELPPESTDVALFLPEMKMIRDRLHSTHQFRPPFESPMPSQSFYEQRIGSVWTTAEEDELKRQVREYSYNWSLISKNISSNSLFVSGEDRRTPWECFERWVSLEGYPPEVAKTQYFRTYQSRIDLAQRAISNASQANDMARQAVGPNGVVAPPQRRRPNLPSRQERKTSKRYYSIIDAMKKQAKKREAAAAKQQQTASNQVKRPPDNNQQKLPTKTPEDYSRLKNERERQMAEKILRFNQQQEAQRMAAMQGRAPNQMGRGPAAAAQAAQNAPGGHVGGMANPLVAARLAGQGQGPGQARRPPLTPQQQAQFQLQQRAQLRAGAVPQAPVAGMSQAHINAMQAQTQLPVPDAHLVQQARMIQEQQRRRQMAQAQGQVHQHPQQQQNGQPQQAQQIPPQHSPPQAQAQPLPPNQQAHTMPNVSMAQGNSPNMRSSNGMNQTNFPMNNMAYAPNGMTMATSPSGIGMSMQNVPAGSPAAGHGQGGPRGLPPSMHSHFAEVENQIRAAHNPNTSPAVIRQIALHRFQELQRSKTNVAQTAMDVAAGNGPLQQAQANGLGNASSPQQYAQLLRQQQQQQSSSQHAQQQAVLAQQAARQASQPQHQRQPSAGGTPVPNR